MPAVQSQPIAGKAGESVEQGWAESRVAPGMKAEGWAIED